MVNFSVVIPAYNEEANIREIYRRLCKALSGANFEIIFVDDGSEDNSLNVLRNLRSKDKKVKIISFSRNFGHQAAITAGLDHAGGDAVIMLDADMQHPPELIPEMIKEWKKGYDIVYGIRKENGQEPFFKKHTSRLFYYLMKKIANVTLPPNTPDFRLMDRKVVETFKRMKERHRFLRGMISWVGFKNKGIEYVSESRFAGETKYSLGKMIWFALDGITSFSKKPLTISFYFGIVMCFFGLLYGLYALNQLLSNKVVPGWTSLMLVVLFFGGVQLITLGIQGEYLGRIYEQVKERPIYVKKETLGFEQRKIP